MTIDKKIQSAAQLHNAGRLAEAEKLYREILSHQPNHQLALHLLGLVTSKTDRLDEGLELLQRAVNLKPDSADAQNDLGNVLMRKERGDEAIAAFSKAVQLRPGFPEAWFNLGGGSKTKGTFGRCHRRLSPR